MRRIRDDDEGGSRATLILLFLILVVAGVLAWQAYTAARDHRRAAERVVRDYARAAGVELITRGQRDLNNTVFLPVLRRMLRAIDDQAARNPKLRGHVPPPTREQLLAASSEQWMRSLLLFYRGGFRLDLRSGDCQVSNPVMRDAVCRDLANEVRQRMGGGEGQIGLAGDGYYLIFSPMTPVVWGYWADDVEARKRIRYSFSRQPILPPTLGISNDAVFTEVRDWQGKVLFRTPGKYDADLGAETKFSFNQTPFFRDCTVRTSIAPGAIPRLTEGGLPRSPLPLLLVMLALTLALITAAVRQVVKERALTRLRSDFVSSVSHELRTPLTQIRMFAETLLLDRVRSVEEERRSLTIIDQEARRLSHLVENVLRLSQSERGRLRIAPEPVAVAPIVAETAETFAPIARARQVDIELQLEDEAIAPVDAESLRQIVLNLLDNAVKYGPAGQQLLVEMHAAETTVRIAVDDEGPGIPPRDRRRIWKKFERLGRDQSSHKAGSGIGLAVVRDLVQLHGGQAWVEDGTRGGARFVVELPRSNTPTSQHVHRPAEEAPAAT